MEKNELVDINLHIKDQRKINKYCAICSVILDTISSLFHPEQHLSNSEISYILTVNADIIYLNPYIVLLQQLSYPYKHSYVKGKLNESFLPPFKIIKAKEFIPMISIFRKASTCAISRQEYQQEHNINIFLVPHPSTSFEN